MPQDKAEATFRGEFVMKRLILAMLVAATATACASTGDRQAQLAPEGAEYISNGKSSRLVAKMDDVDDYTLDAGSSTPSPRKEVLRKKLKRRSR
jgi:hypothetical protein